MQTVELHEVGRFDHFDPNQRRDGHGRWTDGGIPNLPDAATDPAPAQRPAADRLNLTGRTQPPTTDPDDPDADAQPPRLDLGDGGHVIASDRIPTSGDADVHYAVIGTRDGRELWLSSGTPGGEDWDPSDDTTGRLDPDQAAELATRLSDTVNQARQATPDFLDRLDRGETVDDEIVPGQHVGDDFGSVHWSVEYDGIGEAREPWQVRLRTSAGARPADEAGAVLTPAEVRRLAKALGGLPLSEAALSEAETEHTGAMIALIPADADAARLAVNGGEDVTELHLTLAYLGDAADLDAATRQDIIDSVSAAVNGMPAVEGEIFGLSVFNPGGGERPACIVYAVGGDLVDAAHTLVNEAVWTASPKQKAPFNAHITAAYSDDLALLATLVDRIGPVRFDQVRVAFGGQTLDIPLVEEEPAGAEEEDGPDEALWLAEADGDRNELRDYWTRGKGLAKWRGKKHPWTALYKHLRKHLGSERAKRVASSWFHRVFGYWPGDRRHRSKEVARTVLGTLLREAGAGHPDSCETADLSSICHCGCNGTRHGEGSARRRLGPIAAERVDREGRNMRLAAMTDDELANHFADLSRRGEWDQFADVEAELGRRDADNEWLRDQDTATHWDLGGDEPTEQDRQIDALLARGYDFVDAYAEVHGEDPEALRRQQATSAVAADRRDGETTDQAVRRGYDQWVHEQWMRAENDTRGHLLTPEAQAAGIQPVDLFSGPAARARKWASEDLQRWWADNGGRMTLAQYRAQVLGRDSDRRAAELTRVGGNARDFI